MSDNRDKGATESPAKFDSESTIELDISKLGNTASASTDKQSFDNDFDKTIDGLEEIDDMFDLNVSDLPDEEAGKENESPAGNPTPVTDELPLLESPDDEEPQPVVKLTEEMLDEPEEKDGQAEEDMADDLDSPELSTGENSLLSEAVHEFAEKNAEANKAALNDTETPELTTTEDDIGEDEEIPEIDVEVVIPPQPETTALETVEEPVAEAATKPASGGSNTIPLLFGIMGIAAGGFGAWMAFDATGKVADLERRIQILSATNSHSQDYDMADIQQRLVKVERRLTGTPTLEAAAPLGAPPIVESTPSEPADEAVSQSLPATPQTSASPAPSNGDWVVNVSSHAKEDLALRENARLQSLGLHSEINRARIRERTWYRIQIAGFASKDEAKAKLKDLQQHFGIKGAWIGKR